MITSSRTFYAVHYPWGVNNGVNDYDRVDVFRFDTKKARDMFVELMQRSQDPYNPKTCKADYTTYHKFLSAGWIESIYDFQWRVCASVCLRPMFKWGFKEADSFYGDHLEEYYTVR